MQQRQTSDRQHAVFAIVRFLEALKLQGWTHVVMRWLGQYDGLECYMEPDAAPALQVRDLLACYVASGARVFPKTIATDLSRLPFLHYQAQRMEEDWNPLDTPFIEFAQTGAIEVWRSSTPHPDPEVTQAWLLTAFVRFQMNNHRPGQH